MSRRRPIVVMGRSETTADLDPLLIRQVTRDNHVLIFDNRGMGTTDDTRFRRTR